jgi:AcrR family transcriptional regulator
VTAAEDPRITANRRAVYAATIRLLASTGISGLTVDRLADASGVSRSTIYRHWPDLGALAVAAFEEVLHRDPARPLAMPAHPETALLEYLRDYARRLNDDTYATILMSIIEWGWRDPAFAREHASIFDETRSRALAVLRAGSASGAFDHLLDHNEAVEAIVSPFLYRRLIRRRRITERDVRQLHAQLLVRFGSREAQDSAS